MFYVIGPCGKFSLKLCFLFNEIKRNTFRLHFFVSKESENGIFIQTNTSFPVFSKLKIKLVFYVKPKYSILLTKV